MATEKQILARERAYFKFVLSGMSKPVKYKSLSMREISLWEEILSIREELINQFDETSELMGLKVNKNRKKWE